MNIFHAHYAFLKTKASLLLKLARNGDSLLRNIEETLHQPISKELQLKHILQFIALQNGYSTWQELKDALDNAALHSPLANVQEQFYPKGYTTYWNIWFASYAEAKKVREESNLYLLPYKQQYFLVESHFVDSVGLPSTATEWEDIGRDWVHPLHVRSWLRLNELYAEAITTRV